MQTQQLLATAVATLDEHKAEDICVLSVKKISSLTEYFIIAAGTSNTHVRALSDYVEEKLGQAGTPPLRTEGYASGGWVLLDYGSVIIHVFTPQMREFYNLERLWQDGEPVPAEQLLNGRSNNETV